MNLENIIPSQNEKLQLREWLLSMLLHSVATITFKKVDGSTRVMRCTLKQDLLPPPAITETTKKSKAENTNTVCVWDLDVADWRSFIVANVTRIELTIELTNEKSEKEINYV